jgi:predicted nucleic acid-binding protein
LKGFLADTNIPSELTRPNPDPRVVTLLEGIEKEEVYLSVLTLGEIRKGVASLPHGNRRRELEDWIQSTLRPWFANRILPVTERIVDRWGMLAAEAKRRGEGLSVVDGLIAATALEHDLTLLTRNVRDFSGTGVTVLNPWESPSPTP